MRHTNTTINRKQNQFATFALSALLALSLGATPHAAFADEDAASTDDTTEAASEAALVDTTQQVLHATTGQTLHSNETTFNTTAEGACGVLAENGAVVIANLLTVLTQGNQSAAVSTGLEGGGVSITNSQLSTNGDSSPLLFSAGQIEADNITGQAAKSPLMRIEDQGAILIEGSHLASSYTGTGSGGVLASAISLYRTEDIDITSSQDKASLFQANGSTLDCALETGAFFYLTNTTASVILSDTDLEFDVDKAKLLVAEGSDTTSNLMTTTAGNEAPTYGAAGKNGATTTFTALGQRLEGDIEVDSISSLDFFLLEGSTWKGAADITSNSSGADLSSNIIVNIDASSGWTVTENSTVSTLNIEKGGSLVDVDGKAVTIVDADGNKLVDGASKVKVSVTDEFSTTVKTTDANKLQASTIDRSAFDGEFGTSTTFGTNGDDAAIAEEERAAALQALITEWFHNL